MKDFSIGIFTYNHQDFIIELLESIKFQVTNYGKDIKTYLHIVDDCSKDKTQLYIDKWLQNNRKIFTGLTFTKNSKNKGSVYNYNLLVNKFQTNNFKIIAGDDVVSSQNLYDNCNVDDNTLKIDACLILKNNHLSLNRLSIRLNLYNSICKKTQKRLNSLATYNWIIAPETSYSLNLYNKSKCWNLNKICKYVEDQPTWYAMIKNNEDLNIQVTPATPIYWRHSNKSISNYTIHNNDKIRSIYNQDIYNFYQKITKDLSGINRFYISWIKKSFNKNKTWPSVNKLLDLSKYKFKWIDFVMKFPKNKKVEEDWVDQISKNIKKEQAHYTMIQKNALNFINSFLEE